MDKAERAVREQMRNRTDISEVMEAMQAGPYTPAVSDEQLDAEMARPFISADSDLYHTPEASAERKRALALYESTKPDRNAYIATVLSEIWPSFEKERNEISVEDNRIADANYGRLARLEEKLQVLFENKMHEWGHGMEKMSTNTDATDADTLRKIRLYEHFRKTVQFAAAKSLTKQESPSLFISSGIVTATNTSFNLAKYLLVKHADTGTLEKQKYLTSLRGALRTIPVQFAMLDQRITASVLKQVSDFQTGFQKKFFPTSEKNGVITISINWKKISKLKYETQDDVKIPILNAASSITTGCPAAVAMSHNGNVLRDHLWWIYHQIDANFDEIAKPYIKPRKSAWKIWRR